MIEKHLTEAAEMGIPVTLTLTNGRSITGVVDEIDDGTVRVSTAYEWIDHQDPDRVTTNNAGYRLDPDIPPTHVTIEHISMFTYKED